MEKSSIKTRFEKFVSLRRKWFAGLLAVSFIILLGVFGTRYHSAIEIIGFSVIGSVVLTSLVSLISIPVVWVIAGRQKEMKL